MSESNEALQSVRAMILDPLERIEEITPDLVLDIDSESQSICEILEKKGDWEKKVASMERTMGLIKGGILQFREFDIHRILSAVSKSVVDMRSTLVKWCTMLISATVQILGTQFLPSVEIIISSLFKSTATTTHYINNCCKYTIFMVVEYVPNRRTAKIVFSELVSKSGPKRLISVESMTIMATKWPASVIAPLMRELKAHAAALTSDPSADVREAAREAVATLKENSSPATSFPPIDMSPPRSAKRRIPRTPTGRFGSYGPSVFSRKPPTTPRVTNKVQGQSETSIDMISHYMPPETQDSAVKFSRLLADIVDSESFYVLEGIEFALSESIIQASSKNKDFGRWESLLPKLIEKYEVDFEEKIVDVILSTRATKRTLNTAIKLYTPESLLTKFTAHTELTNESRGLFFAGFIKAGHADLIKGECLKLIKQVNLEELSEEDSETIRAFLDSNVEDKLVYFGYDSPSQWIMSDRFLSFTLEDLGIIEPEELEKSFRSDVSAFCSILMSTNTEYIDRTLTYFHDLCDLSVNIKSEKLIKPLLALASVDKAMAVLDRMNLDISDVIGFIEDTGCEAAALSLVSRFIYLISDDDAEKMFLRVSSSLASFLSSENVTIRRHSSLIYARIYQINTAQCEAAISQLSMIQQRVVTNLHERGVVIDA